LVLNRRGEKTGIGKGKGKGFRKIGQSLRAAGAGPKVGLNPITAG